MTKLFFAYIVYLFAILVYSCRDLNAYYLKTVIPYFEGISYWGESTLWYFSFIAYNFFLIYFLNLGSGKKENFYNLDADGMRNRVAYQVVRFAIVFVVAMVIIDICIKSFVSLTASYPVFNFGRDVAISISVLFIAVILPSRKPGTKYIIYGTLSLVFALVVNLIFKQIRFDTANCYFDLCHLSQYNFWTHTINFVRIGWLMEIMFFSLGLAQKSRLEFAAAMIQENSDNEIAFHNHETRSGLTSLELMVFENPTAKSYLHKFREYLSSTMDLLMRKGKTTLNDEIDLARKYFEFRKADDGAFLYEVEIDKAINTKEIEVPKALLIPFIQNAIKYNDSKNKMVKVQVLKKKNANCIQVVDNGRGIDAKDYGKPDSFALQIVSRKIMLFNLLKGSHVKWSIENNSEGKGTIVTIYNLRQTN